MFLRLEILPNSILFIARPKGFLRRNAPIASLTLVTHIGKNSPPDCFLPLRSLLVQIPSN